MAGDDYIDMEIDGETRDFYIDRLAYDLTGPIKDALSELYSAKQVIEQLRTSAKIAAYTAKQRAQEDFDLIEKLVGEKAALEKTCGFLSAQVSDMADVIDDLSQQLQDCTDAVL